MALAWTLGLQAEFAILEADVHVLRLGAGQIGEQGQLLVGLQNIDARRVPDAAGHFGTADFGLAAVPGQCDRLIRHGNIPFSLQVVFP
jgi:hypothetical protein